MNGWRRRPRGRRSALLALAGTTALATGMTPAAANAAEVDVLTYGVGEFAVQADGALWATGSDRSGLFRAKQDGTQQRVDRGQLASVRVVAGPTSLADGTVAVVVGGSDERRIVRLRDGRPVRSVVLPRTAAKAKTAAIAPDGTVWLAMSCADRLTRVSPAGSTRSIRLRGLGCRHVDEWVQPENGQVLQRGADGATWLANLCQGRIVRVDRRERVREWRLPPTCSKDRGNVVAPARAHAEPDGGLRLPGVRITASGALRRDPGIVVPDVVTPGGEWTRGDDGSTVVWRGRGGRTRTFALGGADRSLYAWTLAAGSDDSVWFGGGSLRSSVGDVLQSVDPRFEERPLVGSVRPDGGGAEQSMPWTQEKPLVTYVVRLAAGADGRAWVLETGSPFREQPVSRLGRADLGASRLRAPRPSVLRVLERSGGRLWLQLSCDAPAGRFCAGDVRLTDGHGRALTAGRTRFVLAGAARDAVALTLTRLARRLTRDGPLRVRASLRGRSGAATRTIRVPR